MASPTPPFTLYAYTPSPSSHPDLPLLDPASLYAASLLLNAGISFTIAAPNTWFHTTLPRLEHNASGSSGVVVAEGVSEVEKFVRARQPSTSQIPFKALEAHIATHLEPLVYSVFFPLPTIADGSKPSLSSQIFNKVTFPAYSAGLPFPASRSVPHRLREKVNERLRSSSSSLYKALQSDDHDIAQDDFASLKEGSRPQMKSFAKEKQSKWISFKTATKGFQEEFVRVKTQGVARETLEPIVSFISTHNETFLPKDGPVPHAILHLFSLLAPLILCTPGSILSTHPISQLLNTPEFASLRQLIESISDRLLSPHRARLSSDSHRWEKILLGEAGSDEDAWSDVGDEPAEVVPSTTSWRSYFFGAPQTKRQRTNAQKEEEHLTATQRQAIQRLKTRRSIFIAGTVLGAAAWLTYLFTNVITIQIGVADDDEEEEEEEEEGEEAGEDGEEDDDGWTVVTDDDEVDEDELDVDVDVDEVFVDDE